jgi:hypothetical protein
MQSVLGDNHPGAPPKKNFDCQFANSVNALRLGIKEM